MSELYEELRELIDNNPLGCPPAPEIIDILKILFTEEEAKIALGLGFLPLPTTEIAKRVGASVDDAQKHLETLADKGVVFAREKKGQWGYALVNTFHLFENPYRKGIHDETIKKLTPLWKKYGPKLMEGFGSENTSISRIVPINKEIEARPDLLPHEKIIEMVENCKSVGIGHCACREVQQKCDAPKEACLMFDGTCDYLVDRGYARSISKEEAIQYIKEFDDAGLVRQVNNTSDRLEFVCHCACREVQQKCDAPKEACLMFDGTCDYLVDRGYARSISKEEAIQYIKEFDDAGLVRQVNNTSDRLEFVCHCCPCCCSFLRALNDYGNSRVFSGSAFRPVNISDKCIGCGECADGICPTESISMHEDIPMYNLDSCIGCGICAAQCPNDAIAMEKSIEMPDPPANIMEYGMRLLGDRGKLEKFLEVSTPKAD